MEKKADLALHPAPCTADIYNKDTQLKKHVKCIE